MKKIIFLFLSVTICTFIFSNKEVNMLHQSETFRFVPQDTSWKHLTLREKIGQTMIMLPNRKLELELGRGSLNTYFKLYPVSGFFMGWKLFDDIKESDKMDHMLRSVVEYQQASRLPLIFQEDYENGVGLPGMTTFPRGMSLGATNDKTLAYEYGKGIAIESRSVGVNWVLSPVADVNLNPFNPVTNTRSVSDDPEKVIRLLKQQIHGLQNNGVAATIKHFPGDGVDYRDQHLLTTSNSLSMSDWYKCHGKVFKELIKSGVACIMPGHITLPAYQKEKINGFYPPANLSKELLTNLLKHDLGFKGVIVSDAMVMGGFRGYYNSTIEGEIQSFVAGVDMMLWPSYEFMDSIEARIIRGEISMKRLDDAVQRVWALKERFGLLKKDRELIVPITNEQTAHNVTISQLVAEKAITLVRDDRKMLPINPHKNERILMVAVLPFSRKGGDGNIGQVIKLKEELVNKGLNVDFQHELLYETNYWSDETVNKYDKVIFVTIRHNHGPFGPLQMYDDQAQSVWGANASDKSKIIVISLGSPYHVNEYFERISTVINAYSSDNSTVKAVAKVLLGEIPFKGVSPVNLSMDVFNISNRVKTLK
jgi:beta-N-acetylhexosaminidase